MSDTNPLELPNLEQQSIESSETLNIATTLFESAYSEPFKMFDDSTITKDDSDFNKICDAWSQLKLLTFDDSIYNIDSVANIDRESEDSEIDRKQKVDLDQSISEKKHSESNNQSTDFDSSIFRVDKIRRVRVQEPGVDLRVPLHLRANIAQSGNSENISLRDFNSIENWKERISKPEIPAPIISRELK